MIFSMLMSGAVALTRVQTERSTTVMNFLIKLLPDDGCLTKAIELYIMFIDEKVCVGYDPFYVTSDHEAHANHKGHLLFRSRVACIWKYRYVRLRRIGHTCEFASTFQPLLL